MGGQPTGGKQFSVPASHSHRVNGGEAPPPTLVRWWWGPCWLMRGLGRVEHGRQLVLRVGAGAVQLGQGVLNRRAPPSQPRGGTRRRTVGAPGRGPCRP